jgi:hypothetical protein
MFAAKGAKKVRECASQQQESCFDVPEWAHPAGFGGLP